MELLKVKKREIVGKKVSQIRENNGIPAVIYGQGIKSMNLTVEYIPFEKVYKKAGNSTLINLKIDNEEIPVLIHQISYNAISGKIEHIDFYKIKYGQKLITNVELNFVGESKAVKELGGILVIKIREIEVKCLPKDLINEIKIDLSSLKNFDDVIHVKSLKVPNTIKIINRPEAVIASISKPRIEEEKKVIEEEKDKTQIEELKDKAKKGEKEEQMSDEQKNKSEKK
ncbi:MAG: 50S ribosomal protein L25 [Xanthomonadaceae bacterium]|nr:50S ribosomal protein L25 [Rhodospirillaceae bacterium]NIA17832.1 50S ribosomal protein L25 [Xanthomonadaceae bacterium]